MVSGQQRVTVKLYIEGGGEQSRPYDRLSGIMGCGSL